MSPINKRGLDEQKAILEYDLNNYKSSLELELDSCNSEIRELENSADSLYETSKISDSLKTSSLSDLNNYKSSLESELTGVNSQLEDLGQKTYYQSLSLDKDFL